MTGATAATAAGGTWPRPARVTVIGDALIDELRDPKGSREFVGGAALNVAVGLSLLGDDVRLVAMVGDDEAGRRIRSYLADYGVRLVASPSPHGTSRAISDRRDGEPRYEFNDAARRRRLDFGDAARSAIASADLVIVSCFPFDDPQQLDALVDAIDDPERRLVVDGNPREGMLRDRAAFLAGFERVAARALLVKVGDEDAALLLGDGLDEFVARLRGAASVDAPDASRARPLAVLATAGREGASVHHGGVHVHAGIASLPGPVIDTMGAGDATLSAVAHHIGRNGLPADAASWSLALDAAMTVAAATVRCEGALLRLPHLVGPADALGS